MAKGTKWEGGYVRQGINGDTFYIYKKIAGKQFEVSTGCDSPKTALKEYVKFLENPEGYRAEQLSAWILDSKLIEEWLVWAVETSKRGKITKSALSSKKRWALDWAKHLNGKDLRKVTLETDIDPFVNDCLKEKPRYVTTIKHIYKFLRVKRRMDPKFDPTFGKLQSLQWKGAQASGKKVPTTMEQIDAIQKHLTPIWADAVHVLKNCGWHMSAWTRFCREGTFTPPKTPGYAGHIVTPEEKWGEPWATEVEADVLEAAKRCRARGTFNTKNFAIALRIACLAAGLPERTLLPGGFRAAVGTHALRKGVPLAAVSTFVGHKSLTTTKNFYAWAVEVWTVRRWTPRWCRCARSTTTRAADSGERPSSRRRWR